VTSSVDPGAYRDFEVPKSNFSTTPVSVSASKDSALADTVLRLEHKLDCGQG
jgi:hypothetical protein